MIAYTNTTVHMRHAIGNDGPWQFTYASRPQPLTERSTRSRDGNSRKRAKAAWHMTEAERAEEASRPNPLGRLGRAEVGLPWRERR